MVKPGTAGLVTLCVAAAAFKCWLNELCVKYARRNESYRCKTGLVKPDTLRSDSSAPRRSQGEQTAWPQHLVGYIILTAHAERLPQPDSPGEAQVK